MAIRKNTGIPGQEDISEGGASGKTQGFPDRKTFQRGGASGKTQGFPDRKTFQRGGHPEKHRDSRTEDISEGWPSGKTQGFPDRKTFQRGAIRKNTGIPGQKSISGLRCLYKQNTRVIPDKEQCD